jgi:hypothetical protein
MSHPQEGDVRHTVFLMGHIFRGRVFQLETPRSMKGTRKIPRVSVSAAQGARQRDPWRVEQCPLKGRKRRRRKRERVGASGAAPKPHVAWFLRCQLNAPTDDSTPPRTTQRPGGRFDGTTDILRPSSLPARPRRDHLPSEPWKPTPSRRELNSVPFSVLNSVPLSVARRGGHSSHRCVLTHPSSGGVAESSRTSPISSCEAQPGRRRASAPRIRSHRSTRRRESRAPAVRGRSS